MTFQEPAATFIKNQLKKHLGIKNVGIRVVEMKTWYDAMNNRKHDLFLAPYSMDFADPANWMSLFMTGGRHGWSNEEYDELVSKANSIFDWDKRKELYKKGEKILLENAGLIPLFNPVINEAWKPYLKGKGPEKDPDCAYCGADKRGRQPVTRAYFLTHLYIGEGK
jgi:ABC-type oligopeptide transport system substrate-binding subunit